MKTRLLFLLPTSAAFVCGSAGGTFCSAERFINGSEPPGRCFILTSILLLLLLQTRRHHPDGAMLSILLGLLVLSPPSSAMMRPHLTTLESNQEDDSAPDPNTFWSSEEGKMSPIAHNLIMPTGGQSDNVTDGANRLRMFNPNVPPMSPIPDLAICDMLLNAAVPVPVDQIPLFCLCSHCKGTVGPKGDRGDRGPPGATGSPGRRGLTGFRGRPGFTGFQGIKGQKGDLGQKGEPGTVGFTGTKGARGLKGEKGDRGLIGPAGAQGPQGEAGTCPASCDSVQGPPGPQGSPGPAGTRGLPGVQGSMGPKGVMGAKGDQGRPGHPGLSGQKGRQGEPGVCECTDGGSGQNGTPGEKGAKGDRGEPGTQGVQGSTGLKGDKGDEGLVGPRGPCSPAIQSAFSVCSNQSYPAPNLPVPFPRVLTNQQRHFNPLKGIYTAPVNGTYVFSFHLAVSGRTLKVGLFRNFYPIVRATEGADQSTSSHTVTLHLRMGDRVWLQVKDALTNGIYTDRESSSTFSGYLLYSDSCEIPAGRNLFPFMTVQPENYSWEGPDTSPPP